MTVRNIEPCTEDKKQKNRDKRQLPDELDKTRQDFDIEANRNENED